MCYIYVESGGLNATNVKLSCVVKAQSVQAVHISHLPALDDEAGEVRLVVLPCRYVLQLTQHEEPVTQHPEGGR